MKKDYRFILILFPHILLQLKKEQAPFLKEVPLIISGMASSTIGMVDLPYKDLPI